MGCCGGCGGEGHQAEDEKEVQDQTTEQKEDTSEE